ncbi:MAG: dTDP-4-dehydrorhamnose 3,5-epimerase [Solobacterium sp.]|nr:dTDP-4-dehydrorhamnose 3,5-epimerase [Solobacterium sp.]
MDFIQSELKDIRIIEPQVFGDNRGYSMETWSRREFEAHGLFCDFVQMNHSSNTVKGTLRGIHFQRGNCAQARLVRCVRGRLLDVAVDLRPSSPTYRKWQAVELSEENKRQIFIPRGFGHGYVTLSDHTDFLYLVDNFYMPEAEGGILWCDPELGIDWGTETPILSERDKHHPLLRYAVTGFEDW